MNVILFVANRGYALRSSRKDLIEFFLRIGWKVVLCTTADADSRYLEGLGAKLEIVPFSRGGVFGWKDYICYRRLCRIYREYSPSLVQTFHAKPVILSAIASRTTGSRAKIVSTITGLGHAFIKGGLIARIAGLGYRMALPLTDVTVFQNSDDQALFLRNGWLDRCDYKLIVGSGVDVRRFSVPDRQEKFQKVVLMLGRLLRQKGVEEFIEVAQAAINSNAYYQFVWAGEIDSIHPDAISPAIFNDTAVKYAGHVTDVTALLRDADLFLFPSYREGVPRAIMEASASGIPTVGFDVPGVREVVHDGVTGYLVPFGDIKALSEKTLLLLNDDDLRAEMGKRAREITAGFFDVKVIQRQYVQTYQLLGLKIPDFPIED